MRENIIQTADNHIVTINWPVAQALDSTYAERLGFPKGAKVLILHVDDAGMSFDSNQGAEDGPDARGFQPQLAS